MKGKLSIVIGFVAAAALAAPPLRIGSGPLNASVGNERDAALDRAVAWLVAAQSPEGHWGGSNVTATAAAALAVRGDREEMPPNEAAAVDKAVQWLKSPVCADRLGALRAERSARGGRIAPIGREEAWGRLALAVLAPGENTATNRAHLVFERLFGTDSVFDAKISALLADSLRLEIARCVIPFRFTRADPALAFIAATFVKTPPPSELKPLVENLARAWNDGTLDAVWMDSPEAGWWLARAINRATGGNLTLPPGPDGEVVAVNWRGILAGRWINSQRIDPRGNGHWDADPEKTAFAVLLLNEL